MQRNCAAYMTVFSNSISCNGMPSHLSRGQLHATGHCRLQQLTYALQLFLKLLHAEINSGC